MKPVSNFPTRIPAKKLEELTLWQLPSMEMTRALHDPFQRKESMASEIVEEELDPQALTLTEVESIRENAHEEGYSQGYAEGQNKGLEDGQVKGYQEGMEKAQKQIQEQIEKLQSLQTSFVDPISQHEDQLQTLLTSMIVDFSQSVVRAELTINQEPIRQSVSEAFKTLPKNIETCQIKTHPEDILVLETLGQLQNIELIPDEGLHQGGFVLLTENTQINDSVELRFEQTKQRFLAGMVKAKVKNNP